MMMMHISFYAWLNRRARDDHNPLKILKNPLLFLESLEQMLGEFIIQISYAKKLRQYYH